MGKVIGVTLCKDEVDIIERSILHNLAQTDGLVIADNMSSDGTWEILQRLSEEHGNIDLFRDIEPGYYQSVKMTSYAVRAAKEMDAEWIMPFDADELWNAPEGTVSEYLQSVEPMPGDPVAVKAALTNYVPTEISLGRHPLDIMLWHDPEPQTLPKVAFRWAPHVVIMQGNHAISPCQYTDASLTAKHYPIRSAEQFVKKMVNGSRAYAAAPGLPAGLGDHWRRYGEVIENEGRKGLERIFYDRLLVRDPVGRGYLLD